MKTKVKRLSKRTLAMFLGVLMLITSIGVGSLISTNAAANNGSVIYLDAAKNWNSAGAKFVAYLYGNNTTAKFVAMSGPVSGTSKYYVTLDAAYGNVIFLRKSSATLDWNNEWNRSGDLTLGTTNNCWTVTDWNSSGNWGTYQQTSTASLAASSTSVSTGENVTLTPSLTSNTNYNVLKSTTYSVTTNPGSAGSVTSAGVFSATAAGTYTVTATVTYNAKGFTGITKTATATKNITVTAAATTYTSISAAAKGSTDGSTFNTTLSGTPATISANSYTTGTSALNISAGTVSGYTFYKWVVTAGSGTIGSATTANTTFTPSASNTTVTAQYKKSYTISKNTPTGGSVALSKTSAVAGDSYTVTLTPNDGYKVKSLTLNGSVVTVSNNKYTGTASGTSDTLAFVATFEANTSMKLYIAGRFRVRPSEGSTSWTTTYSGSADWNATSTNIPFTYLSGTTYKVDTYATLAELSAQIGSSSYTGDPVFFVYDTTNSKNWYASSATTMSTSGTTLVSSGGANSNLKFSSTSTDGPVTVYYDSNTHKIWYSIPDLYNVTCVSATGGTVTASPSRAEEGTEITLTIAPTTGYQLKSITAKDSSNATVTLSGTGNTRKFTMPAKNVTVTPVFEKITWSGLTAVGKYSTTAENDASYSNAMSPNPATIAATSATQLDGVKVTAPATDPTGYVFAGWYTTTGSFTAPNDKETTFKPNAADAVAIAKYKKIFTITSSVDNTGTGAGTVTTSKTSVEAGGSYTITATAKSGSAIESVKVNGTAKTATASQTISSVSADQVVKVKFKSNVYLKGTMNATAWAGDVMTANSAGTTYTKSEVTLNAGTTYEFKHWVDSGGDGTYSITVGTWTLNNIATHSTKSDGYGGTNLTITPSVKAKVTFVSDGTKFTSITAIPYDSTTYNVTLTQSADYTITSTYMGVEYTTAGKNANVTVPVYSGTALSYTVTPASGKYLSGVAQSNSVALSPAFSATTHANSYTGTVSSVDKAFAVSATAASKLNVVAKTNKSARGTVTVNKSTAAPGESITITVSPKNGVLKSLTCTYANGAVYTCNLSTKLWTKTTNANNAQAQRSVDGMAAFAFRDKVSKLMTSATAKLFSGANTTYTMTLDENSSATINATFDAYSGESTWYYNGYDTSGNAVSGYHGKQMAEGMVSGEKFSYYHVEGRTGTDQLMTVTDGSTPTYGKVYFTNNYNWNNLHVYFYGSSISWNWPGDGMTFEYNNGSGQAVYSYQIPSGATGVIFNNGQNGVQTQDIDLTNTNGAYYLTGDGASPYATQWDSAPNDAGITKGIEYFYQNSTHNGDYTGDFNTNGFYNHNTANKEFAKPKELGTNTGDYYINVLYPNTTYTINGVTKKTGTNPMIIWSAEPLAGDDETTTVYAKDGSIRSEAYGSTYANIADTKIYLNNETVGTKHSGNITNQTYETYKAAKGDTIVIKTQIGATDSGTLSNAADLKAKYYVRGFCVNGEVSELLEWDADGLYTLTYKVPEDEDLSKIEITPIYYLKDTTANPIVTYRVTGFTDELKAVGSGKPNWGNTLYTYPFYGKLGSNNNALGAYPGQPMVYYKGQYQMQIPQKSTAWDIYYDDGVLSGTNAQKATQVANTNVSGVTMSNGYYDIVHRQIAGFGDNSSSADHVQTYDYGDFFKIFNEKNPVDNIVFDFKYETKKHNFENQPAASTTKSTLDTNYGTNGNGFELLTNFHGRNVDLFGTPLSGDAADPSKTTPVYVVSIGGVNGSKGIENIAGYYATEWMVYGSSDGTNYSRISAGDKNSIPPEVLVLNDDDTTSFNNTTYPSADANHNLTDWKALYTALEAYRGKPVMISYEAADAQIGAGNYATSGSGGATRNDGRWLYSKNGENITGKIKIQYSDDNGANYTDLDTEDPQVTGLSAYFTNDGVEGEMTYATTIDPDKTFDFEAKTTNGDYKFVCWYMEDGTKITTDNASHTERSGSYTFVAKFMQVTTGQLILSHSVDTNATYKGAGTAKIGVVVKNGDEVVRTYDLSTSDITLDDKIIKSDNSDYTIEVTLEATATGNDTYGTTVLANPSGQEAKFYKNPSTTTVDKTNTIVLDSFTVGDLFTNGTTQNVKNIIYHSYFNEAVFNYNFKFTFKDRFGNNKTYYRIGKLTSAQASNTDYVETSGTTKYLKPAFYSKLAPYESNFGKNFSWGDMSANKPFTNSGNVWTCEATITSTQTDNNARTATFKLPYAHTNGVPSNLNIMNKADSVNYSINVTYGDVVKKGTEDYVVAPRQLNDNGTIKNFQYWSVVSTSNTEKEVARCYFYSFNFVAYDNYEITPVYDTGATPLTNGNGDTPLTTISYLSTTRNQYTGNGTDTAPVNANARDVLFNDFVLSYEYNGLEIFKNDNTSSAVTDLGYVVERVQKLEIQQDGSPYVDPAHYSAKSISVKTDSEIKNFIKSGNTKSGTLTKHQILKDSLDNKNRIEFAETYDNSIGWNSETQKPDRTSGFKNYVYKAYTYMIVNGEVTLSDPAYFTMYDEAKK